MNITGTAKKIQMLADMAEKTYQKLNELRTEVEHTQETVNATSERVQKMENEMAEQRAILDAVAREVGVDLDSVSTDTHIDEAGRSEGSKEMEEAESVAADEAGASDGAQSDGSEAKTPEDAKSMGAGATGDEER